MAWPSPRTWELASDLYKINLPIKPAVGESVAFNLNLTLMSMERFQILN